jgi:hypothetical protein
VAAQRIVLTSPWKLGLFVFLLVVGTGFGLIYSYLTLFHGELDLQNPETVKMFYIVIGGVAGLGLMGYLATVTSARPLDRVVRGGKQQQKLMKSLSKIQDVRDADPSDFSEISEIESMVERWQEDAQSAHDARLETGELRQQMAQLQKELDQAQNAQADQVAAAETVAAIAATSETTSVEPSVEPSVDTGAVEKAAQVLHAKHRELGNFVESIGDCAADLSQRATPGESTGNSDLQGQLQRNAERLTQVRSSLDDLAEEANKLAITAALQISRLGEGAEEIVGTAEELRSLSTRFQRAAGDLRVCESDQAAAAQNAGGATGASPHGLDAIVMVLDQSTEGLSEVLTQIASEIRSLEEWAQDPRSAPRSTLQSVPQPAPQSAPQSAPQPVESVPAAPPRAAAPAPVADSAGAEVFDIADLGGVILENGQDGVEDEVYDLEHFGAVEL